MPQAIFTLFLYSARHISKWTEIHQENMLYKDLDVWWISWKYLQVQTENCLIFGQLKKMHVLFDHPFSFIFWKQEQKELLLNFCLSITCYFHLSIKEYCQISRKQNLVLCRTGWLAYVMKKPMTKKLEYVSVLLCNFLFTKCKALICLLLLITKCKERLPV